MRLTTVIILSAMLQVSASSFAQRLNYVQNDATLAQLFKEIKKQTGYNVVWNEKKLNAALTIQANFINAPVEKVLDQVLSRLPVSYTLRGKAIIIKKEEPSLIDNIISSFQAIDVRGTVVDDQGVPLMGATVKVKGTNRSTQTNSEGNFSISGVPENAILVITYLGFQVKEITAATNLGKIILETSSGDLKEVEINAGYYTVTERERTGNISRITAETIEKQPVNNPLMALQNRVPGVEITQLTGVPGGGFTVRIRGQNSIRNGSDPLYIIDGIAYPSEKINTVNSDAITRGANPLSMLNPNDIESIDILKDADATAIYGSRGANGVILISTKKGSEGILKIDANASFGVAEVVKRLSLMNTEQYIAMRMEAFKNDALQPGTMDYDVNGVWDQNKYTDWQEKMIGGQAKSTNLSLNASGGTKTSNYLVGGHYYNEGTVFPGDFGFNRIGINTNINFGATENKLRVSFSANYNRATANLLATDPTVNIFRAPNAPDVYDEYGQLNWYYNNVATVTNPMATLLQTQDANTDNLIGNVNINYRILKNFNAKVSFGYNTIKREELDKLPNMARNPATNPPATSRSSYFGNAANNSWLLEPQLNYEYTLGESKFTALIGMSFQRTNSEYRSVNASNFNSDELMDNISSASVFSIRESRYSTYKYSALFSRLNYSLRDKYFLNLTGRRDGSSRFGPGNQFANFGAFGAAWLFSEESLIKSNLSFLSFGKLRVSYGLTGNDQISDYQFLQLYNSAASYQNTPTLITSRIANPDYAWETNRKVEAAIQLGFLKDILNFQVAFYRNRSSNQLLFLALPPSAGAGSITGNLPALVQNTGVEIECSAKILNFKNLKWNTSLNLTIPENKLVSFPDFESSGFTTIYVIGKSLNVKRFYNTHVDPQSGLYVSEDYNKNGLRDNQDLYLNKDIGQQLFGGFQNSITFKRITFDFLISFTKQMGNSVYNGLSVAGGTFSPGSPNSNKPLALLSRWQQQGDETNISKFTTASAGSTNFRIGTTDGSQSITDNSFVRLKNLALSYNLSSNLLSRLKISRLAVNLQAQNLITITNYEGLDPETQLYGRLPPLRNISLGMQLTL